MQKLENTVLSVGGGIIEREKNLEREKNFTAKDRSNFFFRDAFRSALAENQRG